LPAEDNPAPAPDQPAAQGTSEAPPEDNLKPPQEPVEGEPEELEGDDPEGGEAKTDLDGEGDEIPAVETADVEIEGVTYSVPKALEDGYLRQADYSRKTLEVTEARQAVEKQFAQVQARRTDLEQDIQEVAALHNIDSQLAEFEKVDWNALHAQDPDEFSLQHKYVEDLRNTRRQIVDELTAKGQQRASTAAADAAKRKETTHAALAREIPSWGPGKERDLINFATNHGVEEADMRFAMDNKAPLIKILDYAFRYEQLVKKQRASSKAAANPAAKPAVRVSGRRAGKATADPSDSDNIKEWNAKRERQLARKEAS
jgi:hypothetical protein